MNRFSPYLALPRLQLARSASFACLVAAVALPGVSAFAQLKPPEGAMSPGPGAAAPAPGAPLAAPPPASGGGPAGGTSGAPATGAPAAPPQQDFMTAEFRECVTKTRAAMEAKKQQDFPAIYGCISAEVKRQEGRVAASMARSAKYLSATEKTALDAANAAWRRFRDANCAFYADPKMPPPANLEHADCQLNLTVGRFQEMEMVAQNAARRAEARAAEKK